MAAKLTRKATVAKSTGSKAERFDWTLVGRIVHIRPEAIRDYYGTEFGLKFEDDAKLPWVRLTFDGYTRSHDVPVLVTDDGKTIDTALTMFTPCEKHRSTAPSKLPKTCTGCKEAAKEVQEYLNLIWSNLGKTDQRCSEEARIGDPVTEWAWAGVDGQATNYLIAETPTCVRIMKYVTEQARSFPSSKGGIQVPASFSFAVRPFEGDPRELNQWGK